MVEVLILETGEKLDVVGDVNYTKVVNDIGDISKVNTSYTWSLKFPKTPNNTTVLDGLGIKGVESSKPYESIKVALLDNGISILRNGNLQITETNKKEYVGNIKDGVIDFFNAMGDLSLADLDISELDHDNTAEEIIETWNDTLDMMPYKYILADFNGRYLQDVGLDTNFSNTSLIPSAKVSYLLTKLFQDHGWTYSGLDVNGLYLSFPLNSEYDVSSGLIVANGGMNPVDWRLSKGWNIRQFIFDHSGQDPQYAVVSENDFVVTQAGDFAINLPDYEFEDRRIFYQVIKNGVALEFAMDEGFHNLGNLNVNDKISIFLLTSKSSSKRRTYRLSFDGDITLHRLDASLITFSSNLELYKQKDFLKEIMIQEGVIALTDADKKHIEFVKLEDRLNGDVENWSRYFVEFDKEIYILGEYAQNNYLKHKYSEEGYIYNDGNLRVENDNLKVDRTLFESKAYTNERQSLLVRIPDNYYLPTLKTFEIEAKSVDGNIEFEYKTLADRMFFNRYINKPSERIYINGTRFPNVSVPIAQPVTYSDVLAKNYTRIDDLINNAKIVTLKLALPSLEVLNLDFKKRYYFSQMNGLYLIDRLNYKSGEVSSVDFIKIG